jgi:ribonucleoside-diphosphate reductase alpha chain
VAIEELFGDDLDASKPVNGNGKNGGAKPAAKAKPKAVVAAEEPLTDPFAEEAPAPNVDFEALTAESSSEPAGAAPTSPAAKAVPQLPERITEAAKSVSSAPDMFAGEGLTFERRYTKAGEDVYTTTEWDYRTAAITGEGGNVVFEQKDCEIPKAWSMLATNVVVSKYFRGKVGTPDREKSVKQLISRVADTIYKWGKKDNYFATDADADSFHDELKYLLLHQYMAFNSPVWFNLGVPDEKPQISACFINSVDDTMESILTLAKTEGMLFKWGSGTGTNLSVLRSSREGLKGGGTASGPISFMRGFDSFAAAIKSGGKTRRAAKMTILNADHPDIEEFIECKADAEKKAHALIEAGYSGAFNVPNGAYDSVFFQNANHSVRATDDFMRAVELDRDWMTVNVLNGQPAQTMRARDLMHKIAQAAWFCGDPGMQFDTTANRWHTCSNTARINASNPCVTGDTLVATTNGWQRIDSLVDGFAQVYGADGQPHFVDRIFPTGTKQVFRLRTKAGFELSLTADHKVLTTNRGDVPASQLVSGDRIALQGAGFGRRVLGEKLALAIGVAVGDGCLARTRIDTNPQEIITLVMAEEESAILEKIAGEVNELKFALKVPGSIGRNDGVSVRYGAQPGATRVSFSSQPVVDLFKEFSVLGEGSDRKRFTPSIYELDQPSLAGVLRGLFTADGTVANYGEKSQYISLDSTSLELLQQTQLLLLSFGIKAKIYRERRNGITEAILPDGPGGSRSYAVKEMHSLRISRSSRFIFEREIGFDALSPKAAALAEMNQAFGAYKDTLTDTVYSVEPLGEEQVYDMTEPVTSHFSANGLVVHNCSEFFFLDDTACNLASLNLMRYRTPDGEINVEELKHAVRITITAQEIMVGNAAYPTDKITVNSFDYRPLGLGYANLGALLMARGLAYDSDEGRAYAAAITAILSGEAYHQSAKMAGRVGAFAGYERNKQPMRRVIQMHRDHVEAIQHDLVPEELISEARSSWDKALEVGAENGYRNSQISVLAPTGCLVADSMVLTDRGLMRLNRLGDVNGKQWQDVDFRVLTDEGPKNATKFYVNGIELTRRIVTRSGYSIQGTLKHRIKVIDTASGEMVWKRFSDITPGDVVGLSMGTLVGEPRTVNLPPLGEEYWTGDYTTRVPRTLSPELAELIGYFMGDGSLHAKGPRFCIADADEDVAERVSYLLDSLFNLKAHITSHEGYREVTAHSVPLAMWWEACGFAKYLPNASHSGKGYVPHIPDAILAANDPAIYGAFLRGLYEADGTVTSGVPCWTTTQRSFSEEVKTLALALGLPTVTRETVTGWGNSTAYVLRLRNSSYAPVFLKAVGFMGARKSALVTQSKGEQTAHHDSIYLGRDLVDELIPDSHPLRNAAVLSMKRHNGAITRRTALALQKETGDPRLAQSLGFFYDTVQANEDGGEQLTYDLSVPENVTYIAQGFISHNTIGFLMDCDTTGVEPDIAIVKYKSLVGGGMFKIVNQTVPEALERLGYSASERKAILDYIEVNDTIEGAPFLSDDHLSVFDCAFRAKNGTRTIHYLGHVKMMAAVQPFISGAISKTVNMPHEATPEEIAEAYMQAWKLGIKALAIYRDGSKKTQPLSTGKAGDADKKSVPAEAPAEARPLRRKLPDERQSLTHKFSVGGHEGYITIGLYPDQTPGEIFITMSKEGSVVSGLMDSFATSISLALQYGVPLRTLVEKFMHTRFEPSGFTGNPDIPMAKSIMDYLFRYVALKFLDKEERAHVGLIADQQDEYDNEGASVPVKPAPSTTSAAVSTGAGQAGPAGAPSANGESRATAAERQVFVTQADAPPCPECGSITSRNGACYRCNNCGTSIGCS